MVLTHIAWAAITLSVCIHRFSQDLNFRRGHCSSTLRVFITILGAGDNNVGTIMEKAVCPNCGKELSVCNYINETEAIMKCRHCNKKFKITFDEKTFPSKINSFNWGAFLSGGLWCLFNGKIGLGLFMLLLALFQNWFFSILIIIICLYLGIEGNKLAWDGKGGSLLNTLRRFRKDGSQSELHVWSYL